MKAGRLFSFKDDFFKAVLVLQQNPEKGTEIAPVTPTPTHA